MQTRKITVLNRWDKWSTGNVARERARAKKLFGDLKNVVSGYFIIIASGENDNALSFGCQGYHLRSPTFKKHKILN